MGTTRKLAIKAYNEAHPVAPAKKDTKVSQSSGTFLGAAVSYAVGALSISGADSFVLLRNGTNVTFEDPTFKSQSGGAADGMFIGVGVGIGVLTALAGSALVTGLMLKHVNRRAQVAPAPYGVQVPHTPPAIGGGLTLL